MVLLRIFYSIASVMLESALHCSPVGRCHASKRAACVQKPSARFWQPPSQHLL